MLRRRSLGRLDDTVQPRAYMNGILRKYDPPSPSLSPGKPMVRAGDDIRKSVTGMVPLFMMLLAGLLAAVRFVWSALKRGVFGLWRLLPLEKMGIRPPAALRRREFRRQRNPLRAIKEPAARLKAAVGEEFSAPEVYRTGRAEQAGAAEFPGRLNRSLWIRVALITAAAVAVAAGIIAVWVRIARARYDATHFEVRLELGGNDPVELETALTTVGDLLAAYDIHVGEQDQVIPPADTPLSDGVVISISRGIEVNIYTVDATHRVYMIEGTVEQALFIAGVTYDDDDIVRPAPDTPVEDGMDVTMIQVEVRVLIDTYSLEYSTVYKNDGSLYDGVTQIEREGVNGVQEQEIRVTYIDGREISREKIRDEMVREPVSEVILQGTKNRPVTAKPTAKATAKATARVTAKPTATRHPGVIQDVDEEALGHTSSNPADYVVPAAPSAYIETRQMMITAYTHTGRTTSTGAWPRDTRTLANPGSIAVDPSVIPYGTLLYVTGYGYGVAEDTGVNGNQLDCFMGTVAECLTWGRRRNVDVYIVQYNYSR